MKRTLRLSHLDIRQVVGNLHVFITACKGFCQNLQRRRKIKMQIRIFRNDLHLIFQREMNHAVDCTDC